MLLLWLEHVCAVLASFLRPMSAAAEGRPLCATAHKRTQTYARLVAHTFEAAAAACHLSRAAARTVLDVHARARSERWLQVLPRRPTLNCNSQLVTISLGCYPAKPDTVCGSVGRAGRTRRPDRKPVGKIEHTFSSKWAILVECDD